MVLQPDWAAIYIPRGQGSATLLTRPFLARAYEGGWARDSQIDGAVRAYAHALDDHYLTRSK